MTEFIIATVILLAIIMIGVPIAFSVGITTVIYILMTNPHNIPAFPLRMFSGINSFLLMALPLFMLAAEIMVSTGISKRIYDFVRIFLGRFRGGLAYANIGATTVMGGLVGAALNDVAAMGKIIIDSMCEQGYSKRFACALTAGSSIQSPLIPPSNIGILYAGIMSLSVGAVLYAGLVPGLLLMLLQMLYIKIIGKRLNLPRDERIYSWQEKVQIMRDGIIAIIMPLIMMIGITFGFFTPTEGAGVAVMYALLIGLFVLRNLKINQIFSAVWVSVKNTANLFLIISFSSVFAWAVGMERVPEQLASIFLGIHDNKYVVLLFMNLILLIFGMWMETAAATMLFAPIMGPIAVSMGVDPIHFAVIMIANLTVGLITPPVGVVLFFTANIGKIRIEELLKGVIPYILIGILLIIIVTFSPNLVLFLPRFLGLV